MNRIERLASLCKGSSTICDMGCDHAYSLVIAIEKYGSSKGLAVDVAKGPLENAKKTIRQHHLEHQIQTICSNGFEHVNLDSFDTLLMSGMGGLLMMDILKPVIDQMHDKTMVLEPHSDIPMVRRFLVDNGYCIQDEVAMVEKDIYYEMLVIKYHPVKVDTLDILYGPILRRNPNESFIKHYENRIQLLTTILKQPISALKKEEILQEQKEIKTMLKYQNVEKHFIADTINYYCTYFKDDQTRPTIIVCPGGGYQYTSPRESEPVVDAYLKLGYHVMVIHYRETKEDAYPLPGTYVVKAIHQIVEDSRVGKLIGLGFSAGGHCLLEVILHAKDYNLKAQFSCLMLGYPVITSDERYAHAGSFNNLLLDKKNKENLAYLSLETQVHENNAVPLFLWGTATDESVPMMNSLLLIQAYRQAKGEIEYHLFPFGGHGLSVANELSSEGNKAKESPYIARWVELSAEWLKYQLEK